MAVNPNSIFIWRGKNQLGDEPGIYSNASFCGLSIEFPLTIKNISSPPQNDTLKLEFFTEDVNVYPGYPGHRIIVRMYVPDPTPQNPYKWKETIIKNTDRIIGKAASTVIDVSIPPNPASTYISVAIEIETDIQPGLYDDFLFTGLNYNAVQNSIYLKFGFE